MRTIGLLLASLLISSAQAQDAPGLMRMVVPFPPGGGTEWRGAYLTSPVDPDPWGNRYAVNVEFLTGGTQDVVVMSAGPDEQVDSPYAGDGLTAGDDDLFVLVEP